MAAADDGAAPALTTLATFNGANGANPDAGLTMDAAGDLFGTTSSGGANGTGGTVFEIPKGSAGFAAALVTLDSFPAAALLGIPAGPQGDLSIDAAGDLFGTTRLNGANGDGSVFEITNSGTGYAAVPTTLINFDNTNGEYPRAGLSGDSNGDYFGTTYAGGTNGNGTGVRDFRQRLRLRQHVGDGGQFQWHERLVDPK